MATIKTTRTSAKRAEETAAETRRIAKRDASRARRAKEKAIATAARPLAPPGHSHSAADITAEHFEEIRIRWGWSRRFLATLFQAGFSTVDSWAYGRTSIPPLIGGWMIRVDETMRRLPAPRAFDWSRGIVDPGLIAARPEPPRSRRLRPGPGSASATL